jgi:hypothetical protein
VPVTPNLHLELFAPLGVGWREDATAGALLDYDMMLIDAAVSSGGGGSAVSVNGALISSPNFVNSASVTFSVVGSNVSASAAGQVNSDWNAVSGVAQILNKPSLATVATSGSYTDLSSKPSIPAAQVQTDWNAASGIGVLLNKPTLATVATSGSYTDLSGLPTLAATTTRTAHEFFTTYNATTGAFGQAQPSAADLSDTATSAGYVLRANGTSFVSAQLGYGDLSGLPTLAATDAGSSHHFLTSYTSTTGAFTDARPSAADLSDTATSAGYVLRANGTSFVSAQLGYGDLSGLPTLAATDAGSSHHFLTSYTSTTGAFTDARPSAADLSDTATSAGYVLRANGTSFVSAQLGYGDLSGTPTIPTSFAWNVEGNATGPLSLSNAGYTSTFNQTSAVAWLWANTTTGTAGTTNASPLLELAANCWHGGASTQDLWTIGSSLVAGTDGVSTLTFGHTGSSGLANVSVPSLQLPVNSVAPSTAQAVYLTQDGTYVTLWTGRNTFRIVNQVDNTTIPSLFIIPGAGGTASNCQIVSGDTGGKLIIGGNSGCTNSFTPNSEYMDLGGNSVAFKGTTNGGTQININESSTFSPASGSSAYVAHYVNPTINQTSSASGSYTALKIAVIETSVLGTANKLIDCYAGSSGTTPEFSVSSAGTVALAGTIGTYNGVTTVNQGVAPILAAPARRTSQTAAQSAVNIVASALAGMYRISYCASITTASDISSVLGGANGFAVTFTDPQDSVAKTSNPTTPMISAANTTGTTVSGALYAYAKAGTAITYNFGYTDSHTTTAMAYNIAVYAEYLG